MVSDVGPGANQITQAFNTLCWWKQQNSTAAICKHTFIMPSCTLATEFILMYRVSIISFPSTGRYDTGLFKGARPHGVLHCQCWNMRWMLRHVLWLNEHQWTSMYEKCVLLVKKKKCAFAILSKSKDDRGKYRQKVSRKTPCANGSVQEQCT